MKLKLFIYIPFLLFSVLFFYLGFPGINKGLESNKWPVAKGVILSSTIRTGHKMKSTSQRSYTPLVLYEYTVNKKKYRNNSITSFDVGGGQNKALAVMNKYSPQTIVDVHYNSKNPSESLLETGVPTSSIIFTGIGVASFIFINFFFFFLKFKPKVSS
jgi:hypothetical protein